MLRTEARNALPRRRLRMVRTEARAVLPRTRAQRLERRPHLAGFQLVETRGDTKLSEKRLDVSGAHACPEQRARIQTRGISPNATVHRRDCALALRAGTDAPCRATSPPPPLNPPRLPYSCTPRGHTMHPNLSTCKRKAQHPHVIISNIGLRFGLGDVVGNVRVVA